MSSFTHAVETRRSLLKRVFNYTLQRHDFGLVTEFGEKTRWMGRPQHERKGSEYTELNDFLRRITIPQFKEDLSHFFGFLMDNQGQPQAVRALNVIEQRQGRAGDWRSRVDTPDPSNQ